MLQSLPAHRCCGGSDASADKARINRIKGGSPRGSHGGAQRVRTTVNRRACASAPSSSSKMLFPTPGSPEKRTTPPLPESVSSRQLVRSANSASRPNKRGIRYVPVSPATTIDGFVDLFNDKASAVKHPTPVFKQGSTKCGST